MAPAGQKGSPPDDRFVPRFTKPGAPRPALNAVPAEVMAPRRHPAPVRLPLDLPGATFSNLGKDENARFISWYGYSFLNHSSCYYQSVYYHYCLTEQANNAAPFFGAGKKVKKIGAVIFSDTASAIEANLAIYSATASGLPGNELAGGSTTTECKSAVCWVDVDIVLKRGQKYFFEVRCGTNAGGCAGGWNMENTDFSGAEEDWFHYAQTFTYVSPSTVFSSRQSSPWHQTVEYPAEGAFVIK
jgi:hypothetical protein